MTQFDKSTFDIGASSSTYREKYGFYDPEKYVFRTRKGLDRDIVEEISWMKNEPDWMRQFRLRALELFEQRPMPRWGADLSEINFDDIYYFVRATEKTERSWDDVPEQIKRTFDRLGIPEAERKFLAGVGAQYECLSGDTRVYTARGLVPIKDVAPGDTVFSFDEKSNQIIPTMVKATAAKGTRQVFEVRVGTRTIKATDNHPFLVLEYRRGLDKLRGRYRRVWKYLHELKPGDLVAVAKQLPEVGETVTLRYPNIKTRVTGHNQSVTYTLDISERYNPITLPEHTSSDLMWWLGLYLGDGYIHHTEGADKARVGVAIPETDQPLRQEFTRVTENLFAITPKNGDPDRLTIHSTILARYLEENGFAGHALTKRVPDWVFTLPQEQKLAFLGGYLDADGYVRDHPKNHALVLTSANQALMEDIKNLCAQCGLVTSSIHRFESKHPFDENRTTIGYRMQISGDYEKILSRSPQRTSRWGRRKYHHDFSSAHNTTFRSHTNEYIGFVKIDSITPAGMEPVYDIEVDGPHNFVAEGLIVHNSEVVYHNIQENLKKQGVIFLGMDQGLAEYPDLVKKYFGTVIPPSDNKFAALNSAVWSGGCLTAEARVFTPNPGAKSIAEIRAGDTVLALSPEGNLVPARVLAHIYSGQKPVYRFRVAGRTLEATGNHMFLTLEKSSVPLDRYGRKWSMVWKPLDELPEGSIIAIAKRIPIQGQSKRLPTLRPYLKNAHLQRDLRVPESTNADLMWLLGVWLGDGSSYKPQEHMCFINFALPVSDPVRAEAIRLIQQLFNYTVQTQNETSFTINSKALGQWLEELEFVGDAKTKRIPQWVFGLPLEERLAFLGGLLDADGWLENEGKTVAIELANQKLIEDIKLLAISCGLFSDGKIRERRRPAVFFKRDERYIVSGDTYACRITGNVALIGTRNPDHRAKLAEADKHTFDKYTTVTGENLSALTSEDLGFAPIRQKEYIGVRDVYDIQVEGYANFVANGIIAHNSFIYVPPGVRVEMPLQAYFRINAQNMGQFERTLIIADEGSYVHYIEGCFLAGARVRTREGEKAIEEIRVGDEVLTHRGRFRRVYHTMQRPYAGPIYHIRYYGDSSQALHVTAEHPLLVVRRERANERNRHFEPEWLTAADLKPGDYLTIPVLKSETATHSYNTTVKIGHGRHAPVERTVSLAVEPDLFRLFGYYFSEGHVDNEHYLSFSFNAQETAYLQDVKDLTQRYFGKAMIENRPRQNGQTLVLSSTPVARLFANEFGSTVYEKRVPDWVQNAPLDCLAELVRGMWRGDGSYDSKKNMFRYSSVSRHLAYAFRDALLRLGIAASINIQMREEPRQDLFTVVVSSPWNSKFGAIVGHPAPDGRQSGSPFYLDENYLYVPIRAIEMEEMNTTVYNFSVEEDESYIGEGVISHNCTAPIYSSDSLHSAVVEIIVHKGARVRYTTIQNWSANVYNLVTKRAVAYEDATMEWVDCNLGSKVTMKYPAVYMMGKGARGEILSVAFAGKGQHQDAGGKVVHGAPYTSSLVTSKSISKDGGRTSYRGLLKVYPGCEGVKSNVRCDALLLDEQSRSDTYPYIEVDEDNVQIGHEASVSKIGEEQLFYLMSRGLSEAEAATMIVSGFIEPIVKELPMEFAVEMNRLIQLQMEGSVG